MAFWTCPVTGKRCFLLSACHHNGHCHLDGDQKPAPEQ